MKDLFFTSVMLSLLFFSCSDDMTDGTLTSQLPDANVELTEYEKALGLIIDFGRTAGTKTTKSFDLTGMTILNASEDVYSFDFDEIIEEGSEISERHKLTKTSHATSTEVKVYTIQFEKEGNQGYAISSGDDRINDVFAFVPEGNLADTTFNIGLKQALANIRGACEFNLKNYYAEDSKTKYIRRQLIINPITRLKWNQNSPYNSWVTVSCPSASWGYEGKAPAGCTPIAVAQVVAYLSPSCNQSTTSIKYIKTNS